MNNKMFPSAIVALLGLLVCAGLATHSISMGCATSGCSVYAGYAFAGLNFYHWGAMFFLAAFIASLLTRTAPLRFAIATVALIADAGFLLYQIFFWPCTNCLFVALIIGVLAVAVHLEGATAPFFLKKTLKGAFLAWFVLFMAASLGAVKEICTAPWVASTFTEQAKTTVYFSPTCPSCQKVVEDLLYSPVAKQIAFVPIAKNKEDSRRLAALPKEDIMRADIKRLFGESAPTAEISMERRMQILKNKASFASHKAQSVPLIVGEPLYVPQEDGGETKKYSYRQSNTGSCTVAAAGGNDDC